MMAAIELGMMRSHEGTRADELSLPIKCRRVSINDPV
jgi:hypothetical protein